MPSCRIGYTCFLGYIEIASPKIYKIVGHQIVDLAEHSDDVGTVSAHGWLSLRDCLRSASTRCSSRSSYSKHVLLGLILATIAPYCSEWLSRQATRIRLIDKARVSVSRVWWILAACLRSSGTSQGSTNLGKQLLVGLIFSRSVSGRVVQWADIVGGPALTILLFIFGITYLEHRVPVTFARALKLANKDATSRDEDAIEKFLSKLFPADLSVDDTEHIRTWGRSAPARPQGSSIECNDLKNTVTTPLDLRYIITGQRLGAQMPDTSSCSSSRSFWWGGSDGSSTFSTSPASESTTSTIYDGKCASGVISSDTITGKSDDEIIPYNRAQNDSARLKRQSRVEIATSGLLDDAMPRIGNDLEGWLEAMEHYLTWLSEQKEAV